MLSGFIFLSRWLQAPLYVGLIVAQGVYVYHFVNELWHLVQKAPALIGISSIHLLKTFIEVGSKPVADNAVMWQLLLHLTFVLSALLLAVTDRIATRSAAAARLAPNPRLRDDGDLLATNSSRH
jgi:uncharacterized membrane protein YqhA